MTARRSADPFTQVAIPYRGWNTLNRLQDMDPVFAAKMDNFYSDEGRLIQRFGRRPHVYNLVDPVETIFSYVAGANRKLFACYGGRVADVTSHPRDVARSGARSNRWDAAMFSAGAKQYVVISNAVDPILHFDGSTWLAASITGVDPSTLRGTLSHANRLWFFKGHSLWYLPTQSIGGEAKEFPIGASSNWGEIVSIGSWSYQDAGTGADDVLVVVTSTGSVIVYRGTDPEVLTSWNIVGVYTIPPPLGGSRCMAKVGSDLYILTSAGPITMNEIMGGYPNVRTTSNAIEPSFQRLAERYPSAVTWSIMWHRARNRLICAVPNTSLNPLQYVLSLSSASWSRITNRPILAMHEFEGKLYVGNEDGIVYLDGIGASDNGAAIPAEVAFSPNLFGWPGEKDWKRARLHFFTGAIVSPTVQMVSDYASITSSLAASATTAAAEGGEWDVAEWNQAVWGGVKRVRKVTTTLYGRGAVGSLRVAVLGSLEPVELTSAWVSFKQSREI